MQSGEVTRSRGVAHSRMIGQLARAECGAVRWWWVVSIAVIEAPLLVVAASGALSKDIPLLWWLLPVLVLGVGVPGFLALVVLFIAAPRRWALRLPPGTPVYAEFGPKSIGIGWLGHFEALDLDHIERVRRIASVLVVEGGAGIRLLIPAELLPADVADDLVSTYGGAGRSRSAQLQPTASTAQLGLGLDGVTRTGGVAGVGLADQLAAAVRHSTEVGGALAAAVGVPLFTLVLFTLEGGRLTAWTVLLSVAVMVVSVGLIGYFVYWAIPTRYRRLIPPGAPIEAEFGPQRIGLRLGGYLQTLDLVSVKRIRHADSAFHVRSQGAARPLVIPEQLVPPEVASGLLARFGAA
ncbi:hypothetical protein [Mycolicibacterium houstonense]|uniref:hypothetical protein n=1 Tax=Mycolicibacterium houstonense TaxID=146021 RepID=UPI0008342282|nr:hypothetical protein [Mycolicibacterium houstonense]